MKFIIILFLLINMTSCGSRSVENPAANAATYSEEEFAIDWHEVKTGGNASTAGAVIIFDESNGNDPATDKCKVYLKKKIETTEDATSLRKAVLTEIDRIDRFQSKYDSVFRVRYKNGDLKLIELTPQTRGTLTQLRKAWMRALDNSDSLREQ